MFSCYPPRVKQSLEGRGVKGYTAFGQRVQIFGQRDKLCSQMGTIIRPMGYNYLLLGVKHLAPGVQKFGPRGKKMSLSFIDTLPVSQVREQSS